MITFTLAKSSMQDGAGKITPILFDFSGHGAALTNPSVYNDDGELKCIVRCVNYAMHHSEKGKFPHWNGPLQYIHPENDVRLATENFLVDIDPKTLLVSRARYIQMDLNTESKWSFHGLEDARLIRWNGILYGCGVRRDTTEDGQGRMELSELDDSGDTVHEVGRTRIPSLGSNDQYCEKNWMPIIDRPFQFVRWANPTEIVSYCPTVEQTTVLARDPSNRVPEGLWVRGGSQAVRYKDYYVALGHSVKLWKPYAGEKDSEYMTHAILWDKDFNLIRVTEGFKMNGSKIEFVCGMCQHGDRLLISYGEMDNAAYLLSVSADWLIEKILVN